MNRNRDYLNNKYQDPITRTTILKKDFADHVCKQCDWDYKYELNERYGNGRKFWVAVRDDPAPEVFRSDLFGNIFYAYVGRGVGISQQELWLAAESPLGGQNSESDRDAIRLGFNLWDTAGVNMTRDRLSRAIRNNLWRFRNNLDDNGVRKPLAPIVKS